ncbi:hypothetical protein NW765_014109 [Fusarium oxysporum]|nr:hypothetical protein NW765_014109 [Fusarium oxysporum]
MSLSNGKITKGQPAVLGPPLPTPINGVNALSAFSISYSVMINAPALKCLEKLIDTNTWPYWNALTPRGAITKAPLSLISLQMTRSYMKSSLVLAICMQG